MTTMKYLRGWSSRLLLHCPIIPLYFTICFSYLRVGGQVVSGFVVVGTPSSS